MSVAGPTPQASHATAHQNAGGETVLSFDCPRCGQTVHPEAGERLYGPCRACRKELRAAYEQEGAGEFVAERFEPKMNVVPNQVATKD